jgi:hypothetical protein
VDTIACKHPTPCYLKQSEALFLDHKKIKNGMGEFVSSRFSLNVWCKVFYSMLYAKEDYAFAFKETMDVFLQNLKVKIPMHLTKSYYTHNKGKMICCFKHNG